jgi:hypothetical protein
VALAMVLFIALAANFSLRLLADISVLLVTLSIT